MWTQKHYVTFCNPKMYPHTKLGIPTFGCQIIWEICSGLYYSRTEARDQSHSDPKNGTGLQDASTLLIWDSYLK